MSNHDCASNSIIAIESVPRDRESNGLASLVLPFLEGIIVDIAVPVSQHLATKSHKVDLMQAGTTIGGEAKSSRRV
jgi:hypothetical protein